MNTTQVGKGIFLTIAATFCFASQDALTKTLIGSVHVSQIVAFRFLVFSIFAIVYAASTVGLKTAVRSSAPWVQVFRGAVICCEIAIFAVLVNSLGVGEIHALFACFPLLITVLSVPLLGERVGWRRWVAVAIGFVGTLIIIQPGFAAFKPIMLGVVGCALLFALYNVATRFVGRVDSLQTSLLYFGVVGFVLSWAVMPFHYQSLELNEMLLLAALCCTGVLGHWLLILSLSLAPAVILQPFNYFVLVWAVIVGAIVFGERLQLHAFIGAAIVVSSGIYIALRERKHKLPA